VQAASSTNAPTIAAIVKRLDFNQTFSFLSPSQTCILIPAASLGAVKYRHTHSLPELECENRGFANEEWEAATVSVRLKGDKAQGR